MIAFLTSLSTFFGIKNSLNKLMFAGLILYALKRFQTVGAKFGNGTFELMATGDKSPPKLE
jgi:hypothetical protein